MLSPTVRTPENVHLPDANEHGRSREESAVNDQKDELSKTINVEVDGVDSGKPRMGGGDKSNRTLEPTNSVCCKTCDSTQECQEDIDNPGDYYCKCCWEEYALVLSQQQQVMEAVSVRDNDINSKDHSVRSLHMESEAAHELTTQTQSEYQIESSHQLQTQTLTPFDAEPSLPSQKVDSQPDLRGERNDVASLTSHILPSAQNDTFSAMETTNGHALIAEGTFPDVDDSKCNADSNDLGDCDERGHAEVDNITNPAEITCLCESGNEECNNDDVKKGSLSDVNDADSKDDKVDAIRVIGEAFTGCGDTKDEYEGGLISDQKSRVVDDIEEKNTHNENDEGQNNCGHKPNVLEVDLSQFIHESVDEETETNPAALHKDNEHDKIDEEEDQDFSFGTQEMVDSSKVNGLLTQTGSLSGDDGNNGDAMNEDIEEQEHDTIALNSIVEKKDASGSAYDVKDAKDHQLQTGMSGVTMPSQHPFQSNCLRNEHDDRVLLEDTPDTKETTLIGGDCSESHIAGETEDLYGAETQLLPPTILHASGNVVQVENIDKPQEINMHNISNGDAENHVTERPVTGSGHEVKDAAGHTISHPSENAIVDYDGMQLTPEKGLLSMVSYPNDHLDNKLDVKAQVSSDNAHYHPSFDENPGSQNQLSQDLLEEPSTNRKKMEKRCGISGFRSPNSRASDLREPLYGEEQNAMEWLSCRDNSRSPRLILPALKSTTDKESDKHDFVKPNAEKDSFDADESDASSMFGRNAHPNEIDSIEDTQTQENCHEKMTSKFRRLSRGTLVNSRRGKDSSPESLNRLLSARAFNSSTRRKHSGRDECNSLITPKVLKYHKAKYDHMEPHSEWEDDDRSCAERTKDRYHLDQSQTNYRAIKQLEEVKEFTKQLPSAEELNKLAARKQLLDEIAELNRSHFKEVTELKRELSKLRQEIKQKDEVINTMDREVKEKDEVIKKTHSLLKEKNDIITEQSRAMKDLMSRLGAISSPVSSFKGKQKCTNDATREDSDDGSVVLSALKKPRTSVTSRERKTDERQQRVSRKSEVHSRPFSSEMWKVLQEKGWKYKTGPEPYNKVYVPPDGATHAGTLLGIHFFHGEQVVDAAIERGHINKNLDSTHALTELSENEWSDPLPAGESVRQINHAPLDDSELVGHSKLITMETARMTFELAASFMDDNQEVVSFKGFLFNPLWQRLKTQAVESNLNWCYEKCKTSSLSRNWCFVPPSSKMGSKGERGVDFFVTEEEVVHCVLKEAISVTILSSSFSNHSASISTLMQILTQAVKNNMEYKDSLEGKSGKTRTRRQTGAHFDSFEEQTSSSKKRSNAVSPKTETPAAEKRKAPNRLSDVSRSTGKKKKVGSNNSAAFHSSQTQGSEPVTSLVNRNSPSGPLRKYIFFYSGIDKAHSIDARIKKLGGQVITIDKDTAEKSHGKLFFLSDYTFWRRPKYIFAAALGVPMLHYEWLTDLEQKVREGGNAKVMSSDLYQKHRLPIGLDHSTGVYPLQRASHARDWLRPGYTGKDNGEPIFQGMTIAIAVDPTTEDEWQVILSALGASVITVNSSKLRGKGQINDVDCCLLSSAMLPPQATSTPTHVSEMMRHIPDGVPLLDLAWAHQSIIQRKRLQLDADPRYRVRLVENTFDLSREIYSFKNKSRRYEVGDLVQFSDKSRTTSFGRILNIRWAKQSSQLEVQLLEKTGDFELIDCPSSVKLIIDENCLDGNIVMLVSKDFRNLAYISKNSLGSSIFQQVKPSNESQM